MRFTDMPGGRCGGIASVPDRRDLLVATAAGAKCPLAIAPARHLRSGHDEPIPPLI